MALTCSDCGARIELPPEERRRQAGKFFACPECGASRRLPPVNDEPPAIIRARPSKLPVLAIDEIEDAPHNAVLLKWFLLAIFAIPVGILMSDAVGIVFGGIKENSAPQSLVLDIILASILGIYAYRIWRSLSGDYGMTFRNQSNNFAVKLDDPFVMSLVHGSFYYAYHEAWMMFVITGLIVLAGCGVPWLVLPWFAPHLMRRLYMKQGYRQTYGPET